MNKLILVFIFSLLFCKLFSQDIIDMIRDCYKKGNYHKIIEITKTKDFESQIFNLEDSLLVYCGNSFINVGDYKKSAKFYSKIIQKRLTSDILFSGRAEAYLFLNKKELFDSDIKNSLKLNPNQLKANQLILKYYADKNQTLPLLAILRIEILTKGMADNNDLLENILNHMVNISENDTSVIVTRNEVNTGISVILGKRIENYFGAADLMLRGSKVNSLKVDSLKNSKTKELEYILNEYFEVLENKVLVKNPQGQFGFYWDWYIPYFFELKSKGLLHNLSELVYDETIKEENVNELYDWDKSYKWK
jgi:hypothetical protein